MSVQQTREHFLRKYRALVDRPEVGARLQMRPALTHHMSGRELKSRAELGILGVLSALEPSIITLCASFSKC